MTDCSNVEIRELLPDYLSGTLSDVRRNEVRAHVANCSDCSEELELLQLVRQAYAETTPAVNVGAIVSALPKPAFRPSRPAIRTWRRSHTFQIAAAVSFIALGGMSLAVARSFFNGGAPVVPDTTITVTGETPISFAGGVSDLGDEDLEALLTTLETIEALPVTEPSDPTLGGNGTGRQGS